MFKKGCIPWNKGKTGVYSKETLKKMNKANKGKKLSKEHKIKIGLSNKGKHHPPKRENHPWWKGGITKQTRGYVLLYKPNHPYSYKTGYVRRYRFVMEQHIGRYLTPKEVVHHKGIKYPISSIENRGDDRIENLQLFRNTKEHLGFHASQRPPKPPTKTVIPEGWVNTATLVKLLDISKPTAYRLRRDNKITYKPLKKKTFVYPILEIERMKKVIKIENEI